MNDNRLFSFDELLEAADRFVREGAPEPAHHVSRLHCEWSRDPGTKALESHWVTELPATKN